MKQMMRIWFCITAAADEKDKYVVKMLRIRR